MSTPRVVPGTRGVKTAWTDPEHVRLAEGTPEERVNPKRSERLKAADPADPWAAPVADEDALQSALVAEWDCMESAIWGLLQDEGHLGCGGWHTGPGDDAITCACGERFPLPAGGEA